MDYLRKIFAQLRNPYVLVMVGVLFAVLGAKFTLIQKLGSDVPFWDQWDSEADRLYIPSAEGRLEAQEFFRPHNEHRIFFTKVLAFFLLKLNGQWDPRLQMTINALLHVAGIILLLIILQRGLSEGWFLLTGALTVLLFGLPFGWENTLSGFQSPFYFLFVFSILHLAGTLTAPPGTRWWWCGQVAGLCALLAMGSGFFSAVLIIGILVFRVGLWHKITRAEIGVIIWNAGLVVTGLALTVQAPGHELIKSKNLEDFIESFALLASWPFPWWGLFVLTLGPMAALAVRRCRSSEALGYLDFVLALGGWWFLQIIAIAYARGGQFHGMSPRYYDSLAIGIIVALVTWAELIRRVRPQIVTHRILIISFGCWLIAIGIGLNYQTKVASQMFLTPLDRVNQSRIDTVADFVLTGNRGFYAARPWSDVPYPDPKRLGGLLLNRNLQAILPSSIRPPLQITMNKAATTGFFRNGVLPKGAFPSGRPGWSSFGRPPKTTAFFRSEAIDPTPSRFIRIWVSSNTASGQGSIFLETETARSVVKVPDNAVLAWKPVVVDTPTSPYCIVAESQPGTSLAFTDPVELAFGSWLVRHVLKSGPVFGMAGALFLLLGLYWWLRSGVSQWRTVADQAPRGLLKHQEKLFTF